MSNDHEWSSLDEAGGVASGFTGTIENWNADAEARMADVLMDVGKYVQGESGCLLGHIKCAVFVEDGTGLTLNLIDMDNGVEHHGTLARCDLVKFNFMCAVLDVDEHELTHRMIHAIDDSGLDYHIDKSSLEHHHHHHHHEDDGDDDDDHDEHEHGCCHCHELAEMIDDDGKLRADHHHHDHDHEGHCCCHDHDHDEHEHHHDHDHEGHCCHDHDHDEHEHHHDHDHEGHCCHHHD